MQEILRSGHSSDRDAFLSAPVRGAAVGDPLEIGRLFAAEELGWLRNEAKVLRLRLSVGAGAPTPALPRPDRWEGGFARLAAHPRLLGPVEQRLGGTASLRGTWLWFGLPPEGAPEGGALAAVNLGEPPERIGEAVLAAGANRLAAALGAAPLWFLACYWPAAESGAPAIRPVRDDALWPPAIVCAA